jgi:drug/metabolite transporter (DMT)-like permease
VSILFALLSAFSNATTAVLQRLASVSHPDEEGKGWRSALVLARDPRWLLGMAFMGGTFAFQAIALYFGQLAVVQPVLVTELIFTLALRRYWLHDDITPKTWTAAAMICAGLAAFLVAAHPEEGSRTASVGDWVWAIATRGAFVLLLVALARTGSPARRAALLGCAAALVWAVDAAFVKSATDLLSQSGWAALLVHWPLYAVVVSGVLGTILVEAAFTAGPLAASQPALLIVDPLASIALGIELFGEQLRTSAPAVTASVLGLSVMAIGVVLISVWAPPVMTAHKRTPKSSPVPSDIAGFDSES